MKRILLLLCITCTLPAFSQLNEAGVFVGGSYYIGDLNPYAHYRQTHFAAGGLYRINFNKRFSLRLSANYGKVSGADSLSSSDYQTTRNLSFRSHIIELGPILEMNFVPYLPGDMKNHFASAYLFVGLTYFHMSPQAMLNDRWYQLQPLGTEGQGSSLNDRRQYSLNQLSIPLGIGFKMNVTKRISLSFEYGIRKTFTDYLDDVSGKYVNPLRLREENGVLSSLLSDRSGASDLSLKDGTPRGNSNSKDWYSFSGIILTFVLGNDNGCPKWK